MKKRLVATISILLMTFSLLIFSQNFAEGNTDLQLSASAQQYNASIKYDLPINKRIQINDNTWIDFVLIPPGEFIMGANKTQDETSRIFGKQSTLYDLEHPAHKVILTKAFYISKYEITQEQWESINNTNNSTHKGKLLPVNMLSWDDCMDYCDKLSKRLSLEFSLPTEAQWEYVCRAGTTTEFYYGDILTENDENIYSGIGENSGTLKKVGSYKPNIWGVYDMHGNVKECVLDGYGGYESKTETDPIKSIDHIGNMIRGGAFNSGPWHARSAYRYAHMKTMNDQEAGLRIVLKIQ